MSAADFDKYGKYNVKVRIKTESPKAKINFNYGGAPNDTFIGLTDRENDSIAGGVLVSVPAGESTVEVPYTVTSEDGSMRSANILEIRILSISTEAEFVRITGKSLFIGGPDSPGVPPG